MTQATARLALVLVISLTAPARGDPAPQPATRPAPLPPFALRRLGDRRFPSDGLPRGPLALSPDGRRVAAADAGGAAVWDLATGDRTAVVAVGPAAAFGVAYPSADTVVVAAADGPPVAIDPRVPPHTASVTLIVADPTTGVVRSRVALVGSDQPILPHGGMTPIGDRPAEFVLSPDGRRAAFRAGRQALLVYDAATGRRVATPVSPPATRPARSRSPARGPAVSFGGGRGVAVDAAGQATVFDAATGNVISGPIPADRGASLSADGRTLATVASGAIHLYDATDGHMLDPPPAPRSGGRPADVAFAPAGRRLAVTRTGTPSRVEVLDCDAQPVRIVANWAVRQPITPGPPAWSADRRVLAVRSPGPRVLAFDAATGRRLSPASTVADHVTALAADPDGRSVVVGDAAGGLRRWDLDTGRLLVDRGDVESQPRAGRLDGEITTLRFGTTADPALAATGVLGTSLLDPQTLAVRDRLSPTRARGGRPDVFSPDGRRVAHTDATTVTVADVATGRTLVAWHADRNDGPVPDGVAFSDDGSAVVVRTDAGFRVLDVTAGRAGPAVIVHDHPSLNGVALSPDGRHVATVGGPTVRLYPAGSARPLWSTDAPRFAWTPTFDPTGRLLAVTVVPDDPQAATAVVAVYEAATGRPVLSLATSADVDLLARFVPHRPLAVTTDADGTALVWDLRAALGPADAGRSDDALWADLAADDPAVAYRAGFALADRGRLAARLAPAEPDETPRWRRLIADLSSPDPTTREAAHRQLERAGPAAADEVRRALAAHPGGEAEARLADLARLADASPAGLAEATTDALRRDRAAQVVDWTGGPATTTRP